MPDIIKFLFAVFVRKIFAPPDAPVYPEEAEVIRTSPEPDIVKLSLSKPFVDSCVEILVVETTVPIVSFINVPTNEFALIVTFTTDEVAEHPFASVTVTE